MPDKNTKDFTFVTNPILLLFEGLKNAFYKTQNIAIFLIIAPFVLAVFSFIPDIVGNLIPSSSQNSYTTFAETVAIIIGIVIFAAAYAFYVFLNLLSYGIGIAGGLHTSRDEKLELGEAFSIAMTKLWSLIGIGILTFLRSLPFLILLLLLISLQVTLGAVDKDWLPITLPFTICLGLFLIVLMVRVYIRYMLAPFALFDGEKRIRSAMKQSKDLTKGRLIEVFGVQSIGNLVPFINIILTSYGLGVLYRQMKTHYDTKAAWPKPHILNYLVIFIVGGFILFIALIAALILVVASLQK